MNTKLVNSAAGVILAALTQNRTAAGIAIALDSAQMLMTPEIAAELKQLRARVTELDAQRETLAARLRTGQRWQRDRRQPLVSQDYVSQDELRTMFGIPLTPPWGDAEQGQHRNCSAVLEDPHDSPLHHTYLKGRDLPGVQL